MSLFIQFVLFVQLNWKNPELRLTTVCAPNKRADSLLPNFLTTND